MPLQQGCDNTTISSNIEQLISEGYKRPVAVAIALDYARKQGCEVTGEQGSE